MLPKLSIGVPAYGGVTVEWAFPTMQLAASLSKSVELREIIPVTTMTADHARNMIASEFLKSDAEWLFWIDSDTIVPVGAVERMLAHGKTMVSGLYYGKNGDIHPPIAYFRNNGAYSSLNEIMKWERGEIIKVDSAGMGCVLTHRSVFEDYQKNFEVFQAEGGDVTVVHKNDILGDPETSHPHDGKMYRGQYRQRLFKPTIPTLRYPFFMITHLRTEDMFFFENAKRAGHDLYLDASVECGHLRPTPFTGKDYRALHGA